jgi:hypothetical protein
MKSCGANHRRSEIIGVAAIVLILASPCITFGQFASGSSAAPGIPSQGNDYIPQFARFVTENPSLIVFGGKNGLILYDIDAKSTLMTVLKGERITALYVNPGDLSKGFATTGNGGVYSFTVENSQLKIDPVESFKDFGLIRNFHFNRESPNMVLATDGKQIFTSSDGGLTWDMTTSLVIHDPKQVITTIIDSFGYPGNYLISTTHKGRYTGKWGGNTLVSIPETATPHGYRMEHRSVNFISVGKHGDFFNFNHLQIQLLDAVVLSPTNSPVLYGAGIGKSPIKYSRKGKRIFIEFLNPRLNLTYSIDVFHKDTARILVTADRGVFLTVNGGEDWISVL